MGILTEQKLVMPQQKQYKPLQPIAARHYVPQQASLQETK